MNLRYHLMVEHYKSSHPGWIAHFLALIQRRKLYFPCVEVPITTCCTLCCRDCANLIQFYESPYHVDFSVLISSLTALVSAVDRIDCLRLLGGEPLLYPQLKELLHWCENQEKIAWIQIITNGTMTFSTEVLSLLSQSGKCRVSISEYSCASRARDRLLVQLERYEIPYIVKKMEWKEKAEIKKHNKSKKQLRCSFRHCPNRFFSLLNGRLYLCPRASHGVDLGLISDKTGEYVTLENSRLSPEQLRSRVLDLLKLSYLSACDYCDEDRADKLPSVVPAIQSDRQEMHRRLMEMMRNIHGL